MYFKNATIYTLPADFTITASDLEAKLREHPLNPCPALAWSTHGFVPPKDKEGVVYSDQRCLLIAFGVESKILPTSVIREAAAREAQVFEEQNGFAPGRKVMRDITARVTDVLLPTALTRRTRILAYFDLQRHLLVVDTSSTSRADDLTSALRQTLGELPAVPFDSVLRPEREMQLWLAGKTAPKGFSVGSSCLLENSDGEKVRYSKIDLLESDEVRAQVTQGMQVTALAVVCPSGVECTLTSKLVIRSIKSPACQDRVHEGTPYDGFATDFLLLVEDIAQIVQSLTDNFGAKQPGNGAADKGQFEDNEKIVHEIVAAIDEMKGAFAEAFGGDKSKVVVTFE